MIFVEFRHLVQARSSIFQKHLSEAHMPTAQFKKSNCGCQTKNSTLVKPGLCPNCEPSYTLRKSRHGGHALCGCTTSRGNQQRFDRCKTCKLAGSSCCLVHKTSASKRTAGADETVYSALPEVFCLPEASFRRTYAHSMLSFSGRDDLPLSWLRSDDVPDAHPNNNNQVAKSRQHATCSCITRNGKPQERRRCKIHQNLTPASNIHLVGGKRQHAICS